MARRVDQHQHTKALGATMLFEGREVGCGFTGTYSDGKAKWKAQH